jgi:4-hydroxy-4-methyl-2-oxoglutarate aldolase
MISKSSVSTANVVDVCLRLGLPVRCAPPAIRPLVLGTPIMGRALPVVHYGSLEVFFEVLQDAQAGSVLVVDNQGRGDEACIGDLVALEVKAAGLGGIVIWGANRDSEEIRSIGLPLYSIGATPVGPRRLDAREATTFEEAAIGGECVTKQDHVFGDDDGVVFVRGRHVEDVIRVAREIRGKEEGQAELVRQGRSLREQFEFSRFLREREVDETLTFGKHLRSIAAAIGE